MKRRKKPPKRSLSTTVDYPLTDDDKDLSRLLRASWPGPEGTWDLYARRLRDALIGKYHLVPTHVYNAWARDIQAGQLRQRRPTEGSS